MSGIGKDRSIRCARKSIHSMFGSTIRRRVWARFKHAGCHVSNWHIDPHSGGQAVEISRPGRCSPPQLQHTLVRRQASRRLYPLDTPFRVAAISQASAVRASRRAAPGRTPRAIKKLRRGALRVQRALRGRCGGPGAHGVRSLQTTQNGGARSRCGTTDHHRDAPGGRRLNGIAQVDLPVPLISMASGSFTVARSEERDARGSYLCGKRTAVQRPQRFVY